MAGRLMLLDTSSLYFRAFYALPESITGEDGTPVNALRGLADMIARLVREYTPDRLVACMDADWRPAFRVAALPSYKAHRVAAGEGEQVPEGLRPQIPLVDELLDAVGIARVGVTGYEADDVIGALTTTAAGPVDIVSGDRDLFQLVDDARGVRVLYPGKGIAKLELVDDAAVTRRYGIPPGSYADYALLRGDPSDGLPGVHGVGAKTAADLINRFGDLQGILAALDENVLPAGVRGKLAAAREYLAAAPVVVRVARELPLPEYDDALPQQPADPDALTRLRTHRNCDGPIGRLVDALRTSTIA